MIISCNSWETINIFVMLRNFYEPVWFQGLNKFVGNSGNIRRYSMDFIIVMISKDSSTYDTQQIWARHELF